MRKWMNLMAVVLAAMLFATGFAIAEPRTIDLETMTVEELEQLKKEVSAAILSATVENIDGYIVVGDYGEYARNPDLHNGEQIRFDGEVIQVVEGIESSIYRIALNGDYDNVFYVEYSSDDSSSRVLEGDEVTVFGEFSGLYTYTSTFGGEVTIPHCVAEKITDKIVIESEYPATRTNPAPVGATITYDGSSYYNEAVTELTVTKVIRGDAAWQMVKGFNKYNDKPSSGQEYIIVYVKTKAISSKNDQQADTDDYDFTFVSGSGIEYQNTYVSGVDPELTNLYPGAEHEGIIVGLITKDDAPLLVYLKNSDVPIWFDLNKRIPITLPDDVVLNPLQKGDKGEDVQKMQAMLVEMGYLSGTPDGDFGGKTESAVKAYQAAMGLEATGIADEATLRLILTATMPE